MQVSTVDKKEGKRKVFPGMQVKNTGNWIRYQTLHEKDAPRLYRDIQNRRWTNGDFSQ